MRSYLCPQCTPHQPTVSKQLNAQSTLHHIIHYIITLFLLQVGFRVVVMDRLIVIRVILKVIIDQGSIKLLNK